MRRVFHTMQDTELLRVRAAGRLIASEARAARAATGASANAKNATPSETAPLACHALLDGLLQPSQVILVLDPLVAQRAQRQVEAARLQRRSNLVGDRWSPNP